MKFQTLPVKRRPVSKGIFHRLSAVTRKRQRVSASATMAGMNMDHDSGSKISRALIIIFMIHIAAIALIFIHQRFLNGHPKESGRSQERQVAAPVATKTVNEPAAAQESAPATASHGKTHVAREGESFSSIASLYSISELDLRQMNEGKIIRKGQILNLPAKKAENVASTSAANVTAAVAPALGDAAASTPIADDGMVEAVPVDVSAAPKATAIVEEDAGAEPVKSSGKTHLVKKGDTITKIAKQYKITQDELMRVNSITDPTKLKAGATLIIP